MTTKPEREKQLNVELQKRRRLHNEAIDYLSFCRKIQHQRRSFGQIKNPAGPTPEGQESQEELDLTGPYDPRYF